MPVVHSCSGPHPSAGQAVHPRRTLVLQTVQTGARMLAEATYQAVRERGRREPDVVEPVLVLLAYPDEEVAVTDDLRRLAAALADQRESSAIEAFLAHALPTSAVVDRVSRWNDRRTVASARRRGQLLGLTLGRESFHPDWQFTSSDLRRDLGVVIGPLLEAASGDVVLADQIMRTPRAELGGGSLVEVLTSQRTGDLLRWLDRYRDGYTG